MAWVLLAACHETAEPPAPAPARGPVAARFTGGEITRDEVLREAARLPPALREKFDSAYGKRDLASAMVDRRLLVAEARRRGLAENPEIRRQVEELEERLLLQALLEAEEKAAPPPAEAELRAWYDAHAPELAQPARVHVRRLLAKAGADAGREGRAQARARAEAWRGRLRRGTPLLDLLHESDGPEKDRGGDLGLFARGDRGDRAVEDAAFALTSAEPISAVVETPEGFAVLELVERRDARVPPFEEVRADVESRVRPARQRQVFDALVVRLKKDAGVQFDVAALQ